MSIKIIEAYQTEDGMIFTDWNEACKQNAKINKRQFIQQLWELERLQREEKRSSARCVFRNEPAVRKQGIMFRSVNRRRKELKYLYQVLSQMNKKN